MAFARFFGPGIVRPGKGAQPLTDAGPKPTGRLPGPIGLRQESAGAANKTRHYTYIARDAVTVRDAVTGRFRVLRVPLIKKEGA